MIDNEEKIKELRAQLAELENEQIRESTTLVKINGKRVKVSGYSIIRHYAISKNGSKYYPSYPDGNTSVRYIDVLEDGE